MLVRGFVAVSLGVLSGSAFTKKRRPSSPITLAIWPLAPGANNDAKNDAQKIAHKTSVARRTLAVIAVCLIINALGKANNDFGTGYNANSFQHYSNAVNVPLVLMAPTQRSTQGEDRLAMPRLAKRCGRPAA